VNVQVTAEMRNSATGGKLFDKHLSHKQNRTTQWNSTYQPDIIIIIAILFVQKHRYSRPVQR